MAAEFSDLSLDQLDDQLVKLKKEQFNLRFQRATGQLENTSRTRVVRRDIARLITIARQKRGGASSPQPAAAGDAAPKTKRAPKTKAAAKPKSKSKAKSKR